jgi:succinate-acetate transporter protein
MCWTPAGLVEARYVTRDEITSLEERQEATHAETAPMALFGFAIGTILIGMISAGLYPSATMNAAIPAVFIFAGIAQFIGGLMAFARGSTFGGTTFCSFGAGNVIVATFLWMQHAGVFPTGLDSNSMLGIGLMCFGYISLMLAVAAARSNVTYMLFLLALVPGYVLAAIPFVGGSDVIGHIGGWFLILAAVLAFYAGGAVVVNSNWQRELLPLGSLR